MSRMGLIDWIVTIAAVILLVISIVLIINVGIPNLNKVGTASEVNQSSQPIPTQSGADGAPDVVAQQPTLVGANVTTNAPTQVGAADAPTQIAGLPTDAAPRALVVACDNPLDDAGRLLFDTANGALEDASSHRFSFDLTMAADMAGGNFTLALDGSGFMQTRADSLIDFQVDANGSMLYTPGPGQATAGGDFQVPLRLDSQMLYFRILVPQQGVETQWFGITFENLLAGATGGAFGLPVGLVNEDGTPIDPAALPDISGLEDETGFFRLFDFSRFICTEQLAPSGGQAHFTSRIDIPAFLVSSDFAGAVDSVMEIMGTPGDGTGDLLVASMPQTLQQYVNRLDISFDHYMNMSPPSVGSVSLDIDTSFNAATETGAAVPFNFGITGSVTYSEYNQPQTLDVPADFTELQSLDELQQYVTGA